jgi:thioredoxin-like negative regulator of GroEL
MVIAATAKEFPTGVNFGEVDCDADGELAKSIPVLNVPLVAYYRRGQLVAALIGNEQNVLERLRRMMRDESIGYKDGSEAAPSVQIDAGEIRAELLKARDAYHDKWRNSEFGRGDTGAR